VPLSSLVINAKIDKKALFKRLLISQELKFFEQSELIEHLQQFQQGNLQPLKQKLDTTWALLQQQAQDLQPLFDLLDTNIEQDTLLTALILGDAATVIDEKIANWWQQQVPINQKDGFYNDDIISIYKALQHRFTAAVHIYEASLHPQFADDVENWANVYFQEILQAPQPDAEKIWHALERSRISLRSIHFHLADNWQQKLGHDLWVAISKSMEDVIAEAELAQSSLFDSDLPNTLWYPLKIWQDYFLPIDIASVENCQQHLHDKQALIQPFFDHHRDTLRLLWLDKTQLHIYDFTQPEHVQITQWDTLIEQWQNVDNWQTILNDASFNSIANDIQHWANDVNHLIAIFPTPLGQLAWEALPQLANKLSREISLDHWLKTFEHSTNTNAWALGVTDERNDMNKARFINHTTALVADHWQIAPTLTKKQPMTLFETLQNLQYHQKIYISTHGKFDKNNPLESGLSLDNSEGKEKLNVDLPLWLCTSLRLDNTDFMILDACETATIHKQASNLFDPINISNTFASAGVKTVIGTLTEVNDLVALIFINDLLTLAQQHPNTPWHQLIQQTRELFKNKTDEEIQALNKLMQSCTYLEEGYEKFIFPCNKEEVRDQNKASINFDDPQYWANFVVIGRICLNQNSQN